MSETRSETFGMADVGVLMDRIYRHQRHFYDLTRKYYLLGRDRLIDRLAPPEDGTVLEIGCGTGRNLIAAARAYPHARFFGLDISNGMLDTARRKIDGAGLSPRIVLARADAAAFDPDLLFGHPVFDRVFFSYSLSMIPPWQRAIEAGFGVLRAGGTLHIVDFGQQEKLPRAFKRILFAWLHAFHVEPRADLEAALATLARSRGGSFSATPLHRGYAFYAELAQFDPSAAMVKAACPKGDQ